MEDLRGVAFGFDGGPDFFDFAGFADEEGTADNDHEGEDHELLFMPDAEFLDGLVSRIAKQGEIEFVLFLEGSKSFDGIGAHTEDGHAEPIELLLCVTKLGRFDRSTGSAGFGEEEEEDALAGEVLELDFLAFVGFAPQVGRFASSLSYSVPSYSKATTC